VNMDMKAQYEDVRRESKVIVPFWLIIVTLLLFLPIFIDELMKKEYRQKKSIYENLHSFIISNNFIVFLLKFGAVSVLIYYISDYLLLRKITVLITQTFLEVFGISTASLAVGNFVYLEGFIITKSCLSILFLAVVVGIIFATSINLKKKVLLSFLGFCIIFIWNILRLSILIVLANDNIPHIFAHDFFYYLGGIFMIVVVFKICSILSPEIKKDFSFISKFIKKRIISRYFNIT
ncbi:MAG: exosortase/archaeosortase family protein, partial [Methanomicrobia archaeon]|nr:exosortase/archaeosortase family protein [Methanomicrobia archaeon]